jgi:hypothetical protein
MSRRKTPTASPHPDRVDQRIGIPCVAGRPSRPTAGTTKVARSLDLADAHVHGSSDEAFEHDRWPAKHPRFIQQLEIDKALYSVPKDYSGQTVDARADSTLVRRISPSLANAFSSFDAVHYVAQVRH